MLYDIGASLLNFFMLNSTEYEMCHAHNNKMSIIVDILTFMSMLNTTYLSLKAGKSLDWSAL